MTITQFNYLDFYNLIVNELFGGVVVFIILGLVITTWYLIKKAVPMEVILICDTIFVGLALAADFEASRLLWMFILLIYGLIIYKLLPNVVQK